MEIKLMEEDDKAETIDYLKSIFHGSILSNAVIIQTYKSSKISLAVNFDCRKIDFNVSILSSVL